MRGHAFAIGARARLRNRGRWQWRCTGSQTSRGLNGWVPFGWANLIMQPLTAADFNRSLKRELLIDLQACNVRSYIPKRLSRKARIQTVHLAGRVANQDMSEHGSRLGHAVGAELEKDEVVNRDLV